MLRADGLQQIECCASLAVFSPSPGSATTMSSTPAALSAAGARNAFAWSAASTYIGGCTKMLRHFSSILHRDVPVTGRPLTLRATMMSMALYTESCGRTAITSVVMMSATSRSSKQPCVPVHAHHCMPLDHLPWCWPQVTHISSRSCAPSALSGLTTLMMRRPDDWRGSARMHGSQGYDPE